MTIITGHYEWGRLCSQQHPVAGDYLKLFIELHYNRNMPEFAESQPFVCIEPKRFLEECRNFLGSFLFARRIWTICLPITDGVVCAIQKRFEIIPSTSTNDDTIAREPHEFALHLIIVLRDDYLNTLHVSVKDNTVENGLETSGGCKSSLKKYKVTNESDERCVICMEEFRVSGVTNDSEATLVADEDDPTPAGKKVPKRKPSIANPASTKRVKQTVSKAKNSSPSRSVPTNTGPTQIQEDPPESLFWSFLEDSLEISSPTKDTSTVATPACDQANSSIFKEVCSTPCGHVFHDVCIVSWLVTRPHCPLCRYSLPLTINH